MCGRSSRDLRGNTDFGLVRINPPDGESNPTRNLMRGSRTAVRQPLVVAICRAEILHRGFGRKSQGFHGVVEGN